MNKRLAIPTQIAHEVRRNSYFGCVLCGSPLYTYDHIIEYSVVKEHTVDNMVLLCPTCHSEKTTKKISAERVKLAQAEPFNQKRQFTSYSRTKNSKDFTVLLGSNVTKPTFVDEYYDCIWINGYSYMRVYNDNGWLSLSARISDINGKAILIIDKGAITLSTEVWDYSYVGTRVVIKQSPENTILDMTLTDEELRIEHGLIIDSNGDGFKITGEALKTYSNASPTGSTYIATSNYGAFGVVNYNIYPEDIKLPNIGFLRIISKGMNF